jgi:ribonucleoside-diphosphate reductase alpha chain
MTWVADSAQSTSSNALPPGAVPDEATSASAAAYADYKVIRRNGAVVGFEPVKISIAMTKAFLAVNGGQGAASARVR